jgi:hypothetical protein
MINRKGDKLHLSKEEEFEILKMVLDKFLWIGTITLMFGVYLLLSPSADVGLGLLITLIGATLLLMFTSIITKQFNYKKS